MVFCSFLTFLTLLFFRWRKRFRKVKWLCQGHWSSEWQSWGLQLQRQSHSRVCPKSLQSKLKLHSVTYNWRILKEVEVLSKKHSYFLGCYVWEGCSLPPWSCVPSQLNQPVGQSSYRDIQWCYSVAELSSVWGVGGPSPCWVLGLSCSTYFRQWKVKGLLLALGNVACCLVFCLKLCYCWILFRSEFQFLCSDVMSLLGLFSLSFFFHLSVFIRSSKQWLIVSSRPFSACL